MKMRSLALSVLASFVLITSCKKDSKKEEPSNPDPELQGPQTGKVFHYSFNGNLADGSGNNLAAINPTNNLTYGADRFGRANQAALFQNSEPA